MNDVCSLLFDKNWIPIFYFLLFFFPSGEISISPGDDASIKSSENETIESETSQKKEEENLLIRHFPLIFIKNLNFYKTLIKKQKKKMLFCSTFKQKLVVHNVSTSYFAHPPRLTGFWWRSLLISVAGNFWKVSSSKLDDEIWMIWRKKEKI